MSVQVSEVGKALDTWLDREKDRATAEEGLVVVCDVRSGMCGMMRGRSFVLPPAQRMNGLVGLGGAGASNMVASVVLALSLGDAIVIWWEPPTSAARAWG